jgi:selenide,water dikinase
MQPRAPITTDLILLGAGHAHVEVLRRFAMWPERGLRITLIGREPETPYSGMLPGLIRRDYRFEDAHIDLAPLTAASGARLVMAEATGIDLGARTVRLHDRPEIPFDVLSVDVGGQPAMPPGAGMPVKPIGRFLARLENLETHLCPGARIAVVGAGPAGTELALALARRFEGRIRIALVCSESDPIPAAPPRARAVARAALADADVEMAFRVTASGYARGKLALSDGSFLEADEALWATGVVAPEFLAASGLACDAAGCIRVDRTLRSLSHPFVFAAGDCASVDGAPRPKAGVWAVRAGKPLAANLRRTARGRPLRRWRPQSQALVMLGLGDGRAVAWRNGIAVSGEWVWRWKDAIDRRWMRMYQQMKPMAENPDQPMRCGGCGAKVGAEVLEGALAALTRTPGPDILLGLDHPDDAAVALPPAGMAVVQSVDHFPAFLDDPYVFGQIAAAHALSDLHAMGARPWTALAIASVPYMPAGKMRGDLAAMLRGATETLEADGCALTGGHSGESARPALGFAVTGLADPAQLTRKSGLRAGDALVLTKPLGTGILLAANMRGRCKADWLAAAIASMRRTNAEAARILRAHGVSACTDVTGFGLAGHLMEMLRASSAAATLEGGAIPALPGARELAAEGIASTLAPENLRALQSRGIAVSPEWALLADPQTSGGLLAGIAGDRAGPCIAALRSAGLEAAVVGWVEPDRADAPRLRFDGGVREKSW